MLREHSRREPASFLSVDKSEVSPERPAHLQLRDQFRADATAATPLRNKIRLAAATLLGSAVGMGGVVLAVNMVQANDRLDMYETVRSDTSARRAHSAPRPLPTPVYSSHSASSYAPARATPFQPLATTNDRGQIAIPGFNLNPFTPFGSEPRPARAQRSEKRQAAKAADVQMFDGGGNPETVSGASDSARTICVRLCDGYQHPIANLRDASDLRGHEALCTAMFPGVPTRVFRVAAGAITVDDAVGPDGKTYRQLPMAYAYKTSLDPACARPRTGATTISLYRDFTLRAGDTVVMNGKARVFNGSANYPYTSANFRDFRNSGQVSAQTRRSIDERVGASRQDRLQREVRALTRVQEANAAQANVAVDIIRGGPMTTRSGEVRIIDLHRR